MLLQHVLNHGQRHLAGPHARKVRGEHNLCRATHEALEVRHGIPATALACSSDGLQALGWPVEDLGVGPGAKRHCAWIGPAGAFGALAFPKL